MRIRVAKLENRFPSPWEAYSLLLLIGAAIYIPLSYMHFVPPVHSPLRYLGMACPLCGGTRAVTALCTGQPLLALQYNPFALLMFALLVWGAASFFFLVLPVKRRVVIDATKAQIATFWTCVGIGILANWAYVLWAGMYDVPLVL
jgi:hypothetical protein